MEALLQAIGLPLIPVLVPLAVAAFKKYVWANIPKMLLPIIATALGPALEALLSLMTAHEFTGIAGVALGLAGIGVREFKDQIGKSLSGA